MQQWHNNNNNSLVQICKYKIKQKQSWKGIQYKNLANGKGIRQMLQCTRRQKSITTTHTCATNIQLQCIPSSKTKKKKKTKDYINNIRQRIRNQTRLCRKPTPGTLAHDGNCWGAAPAICTIATKNLAGMQQMCQQFEQFLYPQRVCGISRHIDCLT